MNDDRKNRLPLVTVGMPVYNGGSDLHEGIESILEQTFRNFELVVSDNASTDDTEQIVRRYAAEDGRIRYFRNPENVGAPANYNAVFHRARGRYFKWASANDLCKPRFLEACVQELESRSDVVLCYPRTRLWDRDHGRITDFEDNLDLPFDDPVRRFIECFHRLRLNNAMNGVIRRDALAKTRLIQNFMASDMTFMAELSLAGKFAEIDEFLFYRRVDRASMAASRSEHSLLAHYDPRRRRAMAFQEWRTLFEYWAIVNRSRLTAGQKARLYGHVVKVSYWSVPQLLEDIRVASKRPVGSSGRPERT